MVSSKKKRAPKNKGKKPTGTPRKSARSAEVAVATNVLMQPKNPTGLILIVVASILFAVAVFLIVWFLLVPSGGDGTPAAASAKKKKKGGCGCGNSLEKRGVFG